MAKDKISGKMSGNKLHISISSESSKSAQSSSSPVQKVKSIAEAQNSQGQATKASKKPLINQKQKDLKNVDKNTELLKSIDAQLKSLNTNILKISNVGTTTADKTGDFTKPAENLFGSNFQKGLNDALISLIDSSNFRTKMKQMYLASLPQQLYPTDSAEKIQSQKSQIDSTATNNSYSIQNGQKAIKSAQYLETIQKKVQQINDSILNITNVMNTAENQTQINTKMQAPAKITQGTQFNTNTSNQEINDLNNRFNQLKAQKQKEAQATKEQKQAADDTATKNSQIANQRQQRSIDNQAQNQSKQEKEQDIQKTSENIMQSILQKSEDLIQSVDKNTLSIKQLIDQKAKNKQQHKAQKQKKTSFFNNLFKRKTGSQKKSLQGQLVKDSKTPELNAKIQKQPKTISTKIKTTLMTIGRTFMGTPRQKKPIHSSSAQLMRSQKTFSGKDSNSGLRDLQANYKKLNINESKKTKSTSGKLKVSDGVKQLIAIHSLLAGFLSFYKKSSKDAADRQLYKLRFGHDQEDKNKGILSKLAGLFSLKKNKKKSRSSSVKKATSSFGLIGGLIALVWGGLKFFGGAIGKLILKGLGVLTKWALKAIWAVVKWIAPKLWTAIKWIAPKLWGLLKTVSVAIYKVLGKVLGPMLSSIGKLLVSAFGKITKIFGTVFGKLAGPIGRVFKAVFSKLAPLISKIFGPLVKVFGKVFGKVFKGIGKLILPLLRKIPFIGKFLGGGGAAGGLLGGVLGGSQGGAGDLLSTAMDLLPGKGGVKKLFGKFGNKFGGKLGSKLTGKLGGKLLGKLGGKLGGKLLARGAAGALKAIPGVGLIATAGMAAFDAVQGWKNAGSITGKKQKDLTVRDKAQAATASALSGLTFGLVSSKTMYKGVNAVTTGLGKAAKFMWKYNPTMLAAKGIGKGISSAWNWLTKPKEKGGQTGLQKIGNIGKNLFKMTPAGFLAGKVWDKLSGNTQKKKLAQQKLFAQKVLPNAVMSGINTSQFGKLFVKYVGESSKLNEAQLSNADAISSNMGILNNKNTMAMNRISSSLGKMNAVQSQKLNSAMANAQQKYKQKLDATKLQDQKLQIFPQIIKSGLQLYFSKAKLDLSTGKFIETKESADLAKERNEMVSK